MNKQLGTETLIDKIIEAFPVENEIGDRWVRDCEHNPLNKNNLSYSKMLYEIDRLEPRQVLPDNSRTPYALCSNSGRHSSKIDARSSDFQ